MTNTKTDEKILTKILSDSPYHSDAYNIRKNGQSIDRKDNPYVKIVPKENNSGIDIYIKENTLFQIINIPVIITESGL